MYQALYRKYRPQTFDDVSGQAAVTQTLKSQIVSGRLSHAYLFTGSRGTGKTSCARILAKAVNCLHPDGGNPCNCCDACRAIDSGSCMDVLEIDAASNNGVDNIRDLRDDAIYSPAEIQKRVYIIDEVHMLSPAAFNALLKIIEEPPDHLLFILATTELHKVPATILSRCQRFSFRRISQEDIEARLQYVSYQENIELHASAAKILARLADGGMRDALSLLDQCASSSSGDVTPESVYACLGIAGERASCELLRRIAAQDTAGTLELFNRLYTEGKDLAAMLDELACLIRDILIFQTAGSSGIPMISGVADEREIGELSSALTSEELVRMMERIQDTAAGFRNNSARRRDVELCMVELCRPELSADIRSLSARVARMEERIRTGAFTAVAAVSAAQSTAEKTPAHVSPEAEPVDIGQLLREKDEAPPGFWPGLAQSLHQDLKRYASGFLTFAADAPVRGVLVKDQLVLICGNSFAYEMIHRDDILEVVSRKASAMLERPVRASAVNTQGEHADNSALRRLLEFGNQHSDVINIR